MIISPHLFKSLLTDNFFLIVDALKEYGYEIRVVGGAVRDLLLKKSPRDIDLATTALPDEIMYILEKHGLKYTTRGIMHGTVKVVFSPEEEYEITTRDYKIEERGKKLKIDHEDDWIADAKRRDFTFNSLMMDLSGEVYDYVGGLKDLQSHTVRMIGNPEKRIGENAPLVVRFFKAVAFFADPKVDPKLVKAVKSHIGLVNTLDPDWITKQTNNFKNYPNGQLALQLFKKWARPTRAIVEKFTDRAPEGMSTSKAKPVLLSNERQDEGLFQIASMVAKQGWEWLGKGFYGIVFKNAKFPGWALKAFSPKDKGYVRFYSMAKRSENPHFPEVSRMGWIDFDDEETQQPTRAFLVMVEELTEVTTPMQEKIAKAIEGYVKWKSITATTKQIFKKFPQLQDACDTLSSVGTPMPTDDKYYLDVHLGNVMFRGNIPVLSDPLAFKNAVRKSASLRAISERQEQIEFRRGFSAPVLIDPSAQDFLGALNRSAYKTLRGFLSLNGSTYWWDAKHIDHSGAIDRIKNTGIDLPFDSNYNTRGRAFFVAAYSSKGLSDADVTNTEAAEKFGPVLISAFFRAPKKISDYTRLSPALGHLLSGLARVQPENYLNLGRV